LSCHSIKMDFKMFQHPEQFNLVGNLSENWIKWYQRFTLYLKAAALDTKSDERLISILLTCLGEHCIDIYNSFVFENDECKNKYTEVIKKFENYFIPKKNITFFRHQFFTRNQLAGETIDQFVTDLKNKSKDCEFGMLREELIKDRLVCGILNSHMKERLLREEDLTLDRALDICHAAEISTQQLQGMENNQQDAAGVHVMNRSSKFKTKTTTLNNSGAHPGNRNYGGKQKYCNNFSSKGKSETQHFMNSKNKCKHCGTKHAYRNCPAYGVTCFNCNRKNHYSKVCTRKRNSNVNELCDAVDDLQVNSIEKDTSSNKKYKHNLMIDSVNNQKTKDEWRANVTIKDQNVSFKLDTGAQINVISIELLKQLGFKDTILKPVKSNITTFSGEKLDVVGKCYLYCTHHGLNYKIYFYVVSFACESILGLNSCSKMNLIKKIDVVASKNVKFKTESTNGLPKYLEKFKNLFDGSVGCISQKYKICLKDNAKPVIAAARKIPVALRDRVKAKLDVMESINVIEKVNEPTDWVSAIVIVEKPNKDLRICLDPKHLNENIKRSHYELPTIELFSTKLVNAKYFSILDANAGFWMVPLDKDSSYLCTFSTPFGRYRFKRLPFGIRCAPEAFHRIVVQTFENIEGVESYIDDILVWGSTKEEHDDRLIKVMKRAEENGFKFNVNKCKFGVTSINYLGHIFSDEGVQIDPSKVKAINEMPTPNNRKELERFLGMTNYLSKFIENYSAKTASLRQLLKNETPWSWSSDIERAFNDLKRCLCTAPVLGYFDTNKPVVLSVDSSREGLGAVILQDNKPIAYASKALTEAQKSYAQIELEMLAITFGCERFHCYLYSRPVLVESDHKPLESIFKKPLDKVPMRLQRMLLRVQAYDLNVTYKPGKYLYIADTLSRASLKVDVIFEDELDLEISSQICMLMDNLPVSKEQKERFKNETKKDEILKKIIEYNKHGWPNMKQKTDAIVKPFWNFRDELNTIDGLVFKAGKLVVPTNLRKEMLQRIHEGHLGIERCKTRARDVLFWPEMNTQITDLVNNCIICQKYRNSQCKEPMICRDIPRLPWEQVATDLFIYKNKNYLLVVDYFSNYIEVVSLPDTRCQTVINYLKSIFSRHGIPKMLFSDNGPQYSAFEFKEFKDKWGIEHITSSPYYPKSNGLAERSVQTVKNIFKKCEDSGEDPYIALLNLRSTGRGNLPSPSEILMGRKLNNRLPMTHKMLKPKIVSHKVREKLIDNKNKSKKHYDKNATALPNLKNGQKVMFKKYPRSTWSQGYIKDFCTRPRSYIVEDENGNHYERNRVHINSTEADERKVENRPTVTRNDDDNVSVRNGQEYVTNYGRVVRNPKRLSYDVNQKDCH
jgi:hypothetical protein